MLTSGEFSEPQSGGTGEVGAQDNFFSRRSTSPSPSPSPSAMDRGIPSPTEGEELRRRLAEARARTKELIANYVVTCVQLNKDLARRREAAADRDEVRSELSASVARFALLLRALGEPPERTLILIKTAFSEAAPHQDAESRAMLEEVVKWVVDAYYAA